MANLAKTPQAFIEWLLRDPDGQVYTTPLEGGNALYIDNFPAVLNAFGFHSAGLQSTDWRNGDNGPRAHRNGVPQPMTIVHRDMSVAITNHYMYDGLGFLGIEAVIDVKKRGALVLRAEGIGKPGFKLVYDRKRTVYPIYDTDGDMVVNMDWVAWRYKKQPVAPDSDAYRGSFGITYPLPKGLTWTPWARLPKGSYVVVPGETEATVGLPSYDEWVLMASEGFVLPGNVAWAWRKGIDDDGASVLRLSSNMSVWVPGKGPKSMRVFMQDQGAVLDSGEVLQGDGPFLAVYEARFRGQAFVGPAREEPEAKKPRDDDDDESTVDE